MRASRTLCAQTAHVFVVHYPVGLLVTMGVLCKPLAPDPVTASGSAPHRITILKWSLKLVSLGSESLAGIRVSSDQQARDRRTAKKGRALLTTLRQMVAFGESIVRYRGPVGQTRVHDNH